MLRAIYFLFKSLGLDAIYRSVKTFLPDKVTDRIRELSAKYDPKPLVLANELAPQYRRACEYLSTQIGTRNISDYLEFGVCHGTSMALMFQVVKELQLDQVRLFGFDSFEGLPNDAALDTTNNWYPGEFASTLEFTTKRLTSRGVDWNRTFLEKGWYADTLTPAFTTKHQIKKASVIMIDCDLYSSTVESLDFCAPLIKDTSIIIFDDWSEADIGEKKAFYEFLKKNPQFEIQEFGRYHPTGKLFSIKNLAAES